LEAARLLVEREAARDLALVELERVGAPLREAARVPVREVPFEAEREAEVARLDDELAARLDEPLF